MMPAGEPEAAIQEELRIVEEELAQLRTTIAELRVRRGERWDGQIDTAEKGLLDTNLEEQQALIEGLEIRREELRQRIER